MLARTPWAPNYTRVSFQQNTPPPKVIESIYKTQSPTRRLHPSAQTSRDVELTLAPRSAPMARTKPITLSNLVSCSAASTLMSWVHGRIRGGEAHVSVASTKKV